MGNIAVLIFFFEYKRKIANNCFMIKTHICSLFFNATDANENELQKIVCTYFL